MLFAIIGFGEREGKVRVNFGKSKFQYDLNAHDDKFENITAGTRIGHKGTHVRSVRNHQEKVRRRSARKTSTGVVHPARGEYHLRPRKYQEHLDIF